MKKIDSKFEEFYDLDFLNESMFSQVNYDHLLENREDSCFDEEWIRVYKCILKIEKEIGIELKVKTLIDDLREKAFKVTYSLTSNSDISAYVSDDMDLIAKGYILNYQDDWLTELIDLYKQNKFPCGEILKIK